MFIPVVWPVHGYVSSESLYCLPFPFPTPSASCQCQPHPCIASLTGRLLPHVDAASIVKTLPHLSLFTPFIPFIPPLFSCPDHLKYCLPLKLIDRLYSHPFCNLQASNDKRDTMLTTFAKVEVFSYLESITWNNSISACLNTINKLTPPL